MHPACAQHIPVENPSLEGTNSGINKVPQGWFKVSGTPDVQPGVFHARQPPSSGLHYMGMHSGPKQVEAIGQALRDSIKGGLMYSMSLDLAYARDYYYSNCYGNLAIFGGNTPGDSAELLWMSTPFTHEQWKRYDVVFTPSKSYKYISLWAYPTAPCSASPVGVAVLLDNISASIRQIVKTEISSTPACANAPTGTATIRITGGQAPYQYVWSPGNYTTASIRNVPAGIYQVTATAANGLVVKEQVEVKASDMAADATVTTSACYDDNKSRISLEVSGGIPPYAYTLNGHPSGSPEFYDVKPGDYTLIVQDQQVCADTFLLKVQPPPPLSAAVHTVPVSCSEDTAGSIILQMQGGTPPYAYQVGGGAWQADSVLRGLKAGFYQYEVKDAHACSISGEAEVPVDPSSQPVVNAIIKPNSCSEAIDGQLVLEVRGGAAPYSYRINKGEWQDGPVFNRLKTGVYHYEVKDQQQCSVQGTITITSPWQNCLVVMPTAFSPNGDGNNDVFRPKVYDDISNYHIRIFNRWGAVIYEGNDPRTGWDGVYKGARQDPQTYVYICTYADRDHVPQELKGTVTLVR
ncbi:hypothetical protein GCM10009415_27440 [Chitinophaga japonensis]